MNKRESLSMEEVTSAMNSKELEKKDDVKADLIEGLSVQRG